MQTDAHIRKAGGRLSREDQRRLGDILQRVYDDVIRQGVPERFRELLSELNDEERGGDEQSPAAHGRSQNAPSENGASERGEGEGSRERDRLMRAKAVEHPHNKGSS
jgi:Anti-sigma factor NepR